jgi:hypothetical protein
MAHFAKVVDGLVETVLAVDNDDINGGEFPRDEQAGKDFLAGLGFEGEWVQTSYNANFRGAYAGQGYVWDGEKFFDPTIPVD